MNSLMRNGQLATILPKPPADGVTELVATETSSGMQYQLITMKTPDEALAPMEGDMAPCIDEAANAG